MKTILNILCLASCITILSSCMDVVDVNVPDADEPLLVVDGYITDKPGPYYVKLSQTTPYFDQVSTPVVRGASLVLTDSKGAHEVLKEESPGVYVGRNIVGAIGNSYTLRITVGEEVYEAITEIKRVPPIDSVLFVYEEAEEDDDLEAGYEAKYFGPEPEGVGDFYRFKIYKNGVAYNEPSDLIFSSDELVDGNYIGDLQFENYRLQKGDSVKVETLSINEDTYQFFLEMSTQITNADRGLFANPMANVRTNVINVNPNSDKKAVGIFYGTAVSTLKGVVNDESSVVK